MANQPNLIKLFFGAIIFIFVFGSIINSVNSKNSNNYNNNNNNNNYQKNNYHPNNRNSNNNNNNNEKVLLKDIETITLQSGSMTKSKRTSPIKQMECVGGTARKEYELYPQVIQCYNMGTDYDTNDVQWRCDANLDTSVKLGKIEVSCEGYSYPDDPFVTAGSCGVYYDLEYTDYHRRIKAGSDELTWPQMIVWFLIISFILYIVVNHCGSPQNNIENNQYSNNQDDFPGGFPGNNNNNHHNGNGGTPGNNRHYPNLNNDNAGCANNNRNNGFGWGSLGLAGLAGYFMGRNNNGYGYRNTGRNYYSSVPSTSTYRSYSSPPFRGGGGGGGSGISSSSSSYGGTSRR